MKKLLILGVAAFVGLSACSARDDHDGEKKSSEKPHVTTAEEVKASDVDLKAKLAMSLAAQSEDAKARYKYRHPAETIAFFDIEPGMTVVDILPGNGYYSKILLPYLGDKGSVVGVDYSPAMWALFGAFANEAFLEARKSWAETWSAEAQEWRSEGDASISAVAFGDISDAHAGAVDAVMMVRAFHHLNRFEEEGGFLTAGLKDIHTMLKPGGIVGIVQHRAPESNSDKWAEGDQGYVKQSHVIAAMEAAGFKFVGESEINANPKDQPTEEDFVWRLPPTLGTSGDDPELRAKMQEIGESDRMTLKFIKK